MTAAKGKKKAKDSSSNIMCLSMHVQIALESLKYIYISYPVCWWIHIRVLFFFFFFNFFGYLYFFLVFFPNCVYLGVKRKINFRNLL